MRESDTVSRQEIILAVKLGVAAVGMERSRVNRYSVDRNSKICLSTVCMESLGFGKLGGYQLLRRKKAEGSFAVKYIKFFSSLANIIYLFIAKIFTSPLTFT